MIKIKYSLSNFKESGYDIDIRTEDGGVATIRHNGERYLTEYYQTRDKGTTIDWEKLAEGKMYCKEWDLNVTSISTPMIDDALAWLHATTETTEFEEVDQLSKRAIKLKKTIPLDKVLEQTASIVDDKYYYLPCWFEKTEDGFAMHHMENLPEELVKAIQGMRDGME
jgi:hypothetical protein